MEISKLAKHIVGSEIIKLATAVKTRIKKGEEIFDLTIGDFDPEEFPIPEELKSYITEAYNDNETNYPPADGLLTLRTAISQLLKQMCGLDYKPDEILIGAGARPLIYSTYKALVDSGDLVLYPVPSWNNNHYAFLNGARSQVILTKAENNFMPEASFIKPFIDDANFIALCSPQNPTGTIFTKEGLEEICDLILEENKKREAVRKPVYLLYDQIYWTLTFGESEHFNPVLVRPEMQKYTVYIDGISKSLSATGLRVGWAVGPKEVIDKMKAILTHLGGWAPRPEQKGTAKYLSEGEKYAAFLKERKIKINERLQAFYNGFKQMKEEGFDVDVIKPEAAIYLSVKFSLMGKKTKDGKALENIHEITDYLLDEARLGIVPFYAFGTELSSEWFRVSVGKSKLEQVDEIFKLLKEALKKLD